MKVSVIIPNYNHARYLERRIHSVLNQDYQDYEVLILDDQSTDDSYRIIQQYAEHPKVTGIIRNEANSGSTFKQWAKGIGLTQGEWIWIAESDDWCEKDFLSTLMKGVQDHPNAVLAFAQSYIVNDKEEVRSISKHHLLYEMVSGPSYVKYVLSRGNSVYNASMAVFKRKAYGQVSEKFLEFTFCGDWLFWIEIAQQGDIFISGRVLNYFRKHGGDVSGKSYANGTFYIEYAAIVHHLQKTGLLNIPEREVLVLHIYHRFMHDAKLDQRMKETVEKHLADALQISRMTIRRKWIQQFWKQNMVLKAKAMYGSMLKH